MCWLSFKGSCALRCPALVCACTECASQAAGADILAALVSAGAIQARSLSSDARPLPASLGSICAQTALAQIPAAGTDGHHTGELTGVLVNFAVHSCAVKLHVFSHTNPDEKPILNMKQMGTT